MMGIDRERGVSEGDFAAFFRRNLPKESPATIPHLNRLWGKLNAANSARESAGPQTPPRSGRFPRRRFRAVRALMPGETLDQRLKRLDGAMRIPSRNKVGCTPPPGGKVKRIGIARARGVGKGGFAAFFRRNLPKESPATIPHLNRLWGKLNAANSARASAGPQTPPRSGRFPRRRFRAVRALMPGEVLDQRLKRLDGALSVPLVYKGGCTPVPGGQGEKDWHSQGKGHRQRVLQLSLEETCPKNPRRRSRT